MPAIKGPWGPIPYHRDALGYPAIEARDLAEGAWARGWFHGRDRAVQMRLLREAAGGRLMRLLGDAPLPRMIDLSARLLGFERDLDAQVAQLEPAAAELLAHYCAGLNAGIPKRARLICRMAGLDAQPWSARDAIALYRVGIYVGLSSSVLMRQLVLGQLLAEGAPDALLLLVGGPDAVPADRSVYAGLRWPDALRLGVCPPPGGSNAFAVSSGRSASGGALLMTEPHMEIGKFPPTLYASTTRYPDGRTYIGAGIPGVPWHSLGRDECCAWGLTYANGDALGVWMERCRRGEVQTVRGWLPLKRREQTVQIRGKPDETWTFWDSDLGVIVGDATGEADLPCVRWPGLAFSGSDVGRLSTGMHLGSVAAIQDALREVRAFSAHAVIADASGEVGVALLGDVDARDPASPAPLPAPGWTLAERPPRPLPQSARPSTRSPAEGFVVSANERRDGPNGEVWTSMPEATYRYDRLRQILGRNAAVRLPDLCDASYDEHDLCAARLLPVWARELPDLPGLAALAAWALDPTAVTLDAHRANLGLFHAVHGALMRGLLTRLAGPSRAAWLLDQLGLALYIHGNLDPLLALERPAFLAAEDLRSLLRTAWAEATALAPTRRPVPVHVPFKHLLFQDLFPGFLGFHIPKVTLPGAPTVPFQSRVMTVLGETMVGGPAFHMVFDLSAPGGWYNFPGGASEQRFGPGFGAGVEDWAKGRFLPIGGPAGEAPKARVGGR